MKRVIALAIAGVAALGVAAPPALAEVSGAVYRCEANATWRVYEVGTADFADLTYDTGAATRTGCKRVRAQVQNDGDFVIAHEDFGFAGTWTFSLFGVELSGSTAFAGTATRQGGPEAGAFTIADGLLDAALAGVGFDGEHTVAVHRGTGTCGAGCYTTHMVWEGAPPPTVTP